MEVLERKLSIFTESANSPDDPEVTASWQAICSLEAQCVAKFDLQPTYAGI